MPEATSFTHGLSLLRPRRKWDPRTGFSAGATVDLSTKLGSLCLPNPVMPAAGTYGVGTESSSFGSLSDLACFTTKSLSFEPWEGHQGKNLAPTSSGGMVNSVGLKNPGIQRWLAEHYPNLVRLGCRIVVSIWGHDEQEVFQCASAVGPCEQVVAVELNLSCPNHRDPRFLVSNDPRAVGDYVAAASEALTPSSMQIWAKLAPTTPDLVSVAEAAVSNGADAVTLVNTLSAMEVDLENRRPVVSGTYGGLSGPPLRPVALRAVHQVHNALPEVPIVGVGGVGSGRDALELIAVGASAIQVGTASFRDPRAPHRVLREVQEWCWKHNTTPSEMVGCIRGNAFSYPEDSG